MTSSPPTDALPMSVNGGVVSMGRRNTLVFEQKMECHDEAQTSIIFYAGTEDRDMGLLSAGRIHELNRARI